MATDKALELEMRRRIYELLIDYPGLHIREIERQLKTSSSLVEYHVKALLEADLLTEEQEEGYRRLYPKRARGEPLTSDDKKVLGILREKVPLQIVLGILDKGGPVQHRELMESVDVSKSTLSFHLKKLEARGILGKNPKGENKGFFVVDPLLVTRLLVQHKPTPDFMQDYGDLWLSIYAKA